MGGEHSTLSAPSSPNTGSSPRGRGTRRHDLGRQGEDRFIPAWAGNTATGIRTAWRQTVHPRVGGEHCPPSAITRAGPGSSPRGRGTRRRRHRRPRQHRFIPAWAGNTTSTPRSGVSTTVHPRVGGEHRRKVVLAQSEYGSSPRGRGTPGEAVRRSPGRWFIPAWAGNTYQTVRNEALKTVHPRVGGEHTGTPKSVGSGTGSSPRGRGTQQMARAIHRRRRFIPAWAGNTVDGLARVPPGSVHPRVGGEHAVMSTDRSVFVGSSPRGRGTPASVSWAQDGSWFIPAWAGNTRDTKRRILHQPVHPRVGGEHLVFIEKLTARTGSSPRGRGTHRQIRRRQAGRRFIPAWAGNTRITGPPPARTPVHPRVGGEHIPLHAGEAKCAGSSPRGRGTRATSGRCS